MKKIYLFLALAASAHFTQAAINFSIVGSKVRSFYLNASGTEDCAIHLKNKQSGNIELEYARLELDYPSAWDKSFCDNMSCFPNFVQNGAFSTIAPNEDVSFKITVGPNGKADTATIKYVVWDKNNPQDKDTVEWNIYVRWSAGVSGASPTLAKAYPNPCTDLLTIQSNSPSTLSLIDLQGREVLSQKLSQGNNNVVISKLRSGTYFLIVRNEAYIQREKIIKD